MAARQEMYAPGVNRHALTIVDGVSGDRRRITLAALHGLLADPVIYAIDVHEPSLRSFVSGLCRAVKHLAPGARFSFTRAYTSALAGDEPLAELTRWLTVNLARRRPTIVLEGIERLAEVRGVALRLVAGLAAAEAARFVLLVDRIEDVPLARWLAEGLCGVPVPFAALPPPALTVAPPPRPEPRDARERLLRAIARNERDRVATILRDDGMVLIDTGDADVVDEALDLLGQRSMDPMTMALYAVCESRRNRTDVAESWFRSALDAAPDVPTRAAIAQRFAGEFMRRSRFDVIDVVTPYLDDRQIRPVDRAAMLALRAESLAMRGQADEARATIARALEIGSDDDDTLRRARLGARTAFVYHCVGDDELAVTHAGLTVALADGEGYDDIAASASSVLQFVAYQRGGPEAALRHLYAIANYAVRSSNHSIHVYALTAALELEVERANLAGIDALERELAAYDVHYAAIEAAECLVPARALVMAWNGEFRRAYDLLVPTLEHDTRAGARSLRHAELALYAAAAGDAAAARASLAALEAEGADEIDPRGRERAVLLAALSRRLLGDPVALSPVLPGNPRDDALHQAIAAVVGSEAGPAGAERIWRALERLHDVQYGGIARLIAALPQAVCG